MKSLDVRGIIEAVYEKAERIGRKYRMLIYAGTFIVVAGAFLALDYVPKSQAITQLDEDISRLENELRIARIRANKIQQFRKEHATVKKRFEAALKLLPDQREIPQLLRSISAMGMDSNLEFQLISPQPENSREFYMEIPVLLEIKGDYGSLTRFFNRVGRMDRIINIVNISMKPENPLSTRLLTKCTAITYRFKSEADVQKEQKAKKKK